MTQTTPLIDPNLTDALQHWNQYCAESRQNALILLNAITPLKDQIQVTGQLLESAQKTNWLEASTKFTDPTTLAGAFGELADIQIAALGKMQEGYSAFLKTAQASGDQLSKLGKDVDSPQALLAASLETSLNILKQYEADATEEASSMSTIQAAYRAWLQKNLLALGGA
ncbi:hypothetical protein A8C75_10275 [Marinobacterium aestuarii]|uniref:Phasin domain-containing protein n=1 Tax=Marinobacterium aestuarii TaxID=1821621 RepID=A0A1A9EYK4_9GAMM|nr:hypothetical protein [Marinobacterium aestuarii]ANG62830.1 hypothetical protein A8C75_10275 [Marinobacterium aestuarii]